MAENIIDFIRGTDIRLHENPELLLQARKEAFIKAISRGADITTLDTDTDNSAIFLDLDVRSGQQGQFRDKTLFMPIFKNYRGEIFVLDDSGRLYPVNEDGVSLLSTDDHSLFSDKGYPRRASFDAWLKGKGKDAKTLVPRIVLIHKDKSKHRR